MSTELTYLTLTATLTALLLVPYLLNAMAVRGMRAVFLSGAPLESEVPLSPWARRLRAAHSKMPVRTWVCLRVSYWSRMTQPASRFFVVSQVLTGRYQPVADPPPPCDHGGFVFEEPHSYILTST